MGLGECACFRASCIHQDPEHEVDEYPRIVMFVQGVDMDLTDSRAYTAHKQSSSSPTLAAYCFADDNLPMFEYLLFFSFVFYLFGLGKQCWECRVVSSPLEV
jgi:hypothetical protein